MPKVITITYDEQRDAFAAGFERAFSERMLKGEKAILRGREWKLVDRHGDESFASARMTFALDALLGFMERTKDDDR